MSICDEYRSGPTLRRFCMNCGYAKGAHYETAPAVDSDDGPEQSGAPLPPQGAPLQNDPDTPCDDYPDCSGYPLRSCGYCGTRRQNASPVDPAAPDATGLATDDVMAGAGWDRAIELSAHVGRLMGVLELIVADYDNERSAWPATLDLARDAIARAREATA